MGSASRGAKAATALGAIALIALLVIPAALAAFGSKTQNENDIVTAAPDFTPPAITATVASKALGGITGYVRKGGGYYVYANVSADTGNPASGIAGVKANAAELTTGQTEAALTAGTYTAGGVTYNYRSAELIATATVEGSKTYSVTATDKAGNAKSLGGTAIVDNLIPTASNIGTTNGGGTVGLAEQGDTVVFTFSEPIDPQSILAGWNGSATNVVVRMVDNGLAGISTGNDELFVYAAGSKTTQLPLGTVNMGSGGYVTSLLGGGLGGSIYFGVTGTASSMVMSGNKVTITLGTYEAESILVGRITATTAGTMIWTPAATPYDRAGNVMSTATANQSPAPTKAF
jgi:hypothetical protein